MPKKNSRSTAEDNGRRGNGRFAAGNQFGKGNPHAQRVAKLRSTLLKAVTQTDMRAMIKRMVDEAKNGDVQACKLVLSYAIGRPPETIDPDELEAKAWELAKRMPSASERVLAELDGKCDLQLPIDRR